MLNFKYTKAVITDLPSIVSLLNEDELGSTRETSFSKLDPRYLHAFSIIN